MISEWIEELIEPFFEGIKRKDMPQLRDKEIGEVTDLLNNMNVRYYRKKVQCDDLNPIQDDFNIEKRDGMMQSLLNGTMKIEPIFVSNDNFILDGHHRFLACKKLYGNDYKIPVIQLDLPKIRALKMFSKVVNESPDRTGNNQKWYDSDARPFGYFQNKMYIGTSGGRHVDIPKYFYNFPVNTRVSRDNFKFPGRFWAKKKVISFWEYPKNQLQLRKILKDINNFMGKKFFDKTWYIELPNDVWVPINDYRGTNFKPHSLRNSEHMKSPLLKGIRQFSSQKRKGGMTQTQYHQLRFTSENAVIVYSGKFQPFHRGHNYIYNYLVEMFGSDNVYIGTSNKVVPFTSPFTFLEKKRIIHELFDIPHRKIVQLKNPYQPEEIFENYDRNKTVYITVISEKDSKRFEKSQYFKLYDEKNLKPLTEQGYYIITPTITFGGNINSSSQIREIFGGHCNVNRKIDLFREVYGEYNEEFFDLMVNRLTEHIKQIKVSKEIVDDFLINNNLKEILSEVSRTGGGSVDDGPAFIYKNYYHYKGESDNIVQRLGQTVIDYIMDQDDNFIDFTYRFDIVPVVSFGTSGASLHKSKNPVRKYKNHISKIAETVGMSIIDWLGAEQSEIDIEIEAPEQYRRKEMMKFYDSGETMSDDRIDKTGKLQEGSMSVEEFMDKGYC